MKAAVADSRATGQNLSHAQDNLVDVEERNFSIMALDGWMELDGTGWNWMELL